LPIPHPSSQNSHILIISCSFESIRTFPPPRSSNFTGLAWVRPFPTVEQEYREHHGTQETSDGFPS
jgi:hypothetical protein